MRFLHTHRPGFLFGWNTFGVLLLGPAIATKRFFDTLNKLERKLNATTGQKSFPD